METSTSLVHRCEENSGFVYRRSAHEKHVNHEAGNQNKESVLERLNRSDPDLCHAKEKALGTSWDCVG